MSKTGNGTEVERYPCRAASCDPGHLVAGGQRVRRPPGAGPWRSGRAGTKRGVAAWGRARLHPQGSSTTGPRRWPTRTRPGQRDPHQRGPALRRPRPPGTPPRVTNPRDLVLWTRGAVMATPRPAATVPTVGTSTCTSTTPTPGASFRVRTTDAPADPFSDIVTHLTPFFVSRQVDAAGRSAWARTGRRPATRSRSGPTSSRSRSGRDHAQAADRHPRRAARRRRQVPSAAFIIGDANLSEISTTKVGTMAWCCR